MKVTINTAVTWVAKNWYVKADVFFNIIAAQRGLCNYLIQLNAKFLKILFGFSPFVNLVSAILIMRK